jgi:hypothetical protein
MHISPDLLVFCITAIVLILTPGPRRLHATIRTQEPVGTAALSHD